MKIRWKYFLILFVFSMIPLCVVTIINQKRIISLEQRIKDDIHNTLSQFEKTHHTLISEPELLFMELSEHTHKKLTSYGNVQIIISGGIAVLTLIGAAIAAYLASCATNQMLLDISSAFERLTKGDFSVRLAVSTGDEREQIFDIFNKMVSRLEEHFHVRKSLDLARKVQQSLLPRSIPRIPGLDIVGLSIYCDKIGGDYYDVFHVGNADENRFAVIVGDVSGHGVSSALLMATARAMIRLRASIPGNVENIITDVNRLLALDTYHTGHFMSLFYCEFDMNARMMRWIRAGHDPAIVYDSNTDEFCELKDHHSLLLGVDENFVYHEFQNNLTPGQIIFIGTDGIWEMQNSEGEMFGMDRLRTVITSNDTASSHEIMNAIIEALNQFRGNNKPDDDVTLVIIKVRSEK